MLPAFWLAVDGSRPENVRKKLELIAGVEGDYGLKLNLDLVLRSWSMIREVQDSTGRPLFVDTKMNNGRRTMTEIIHMLADEGVAMTNAYALADHLLEEPARAADNAGMMFLGLTVMTHHTDAYCRKFHGRTMAETVRLLAEVALKRGCDGYILPGTCLHAVADLGGVKFNPAVRPPWVADKKANLQEQVVTIQEAFENGAHLVSCGSPVFNAENPRDALKQILSEVRQAKS
ncbi:MAG: orotidine 5'-phosphate decarboxylase / HUMPS family protein [Patescibacteria group bacterium]